MSKGWLITGVSSGLGNELAKAALAEGHRVAGTVRRAADAKAFEALSDGSAKAIILDLADEAAIPSAVKAAEAWLGQIDVLANNAGYNQVGAFEELSPAEFRLAMDTNFFGPVAMVRAVLPQMRARRSGDILNFTSSAGRVALPGLSAYSSSKFALSGFSESLAKEMAPFGIRVMTIMPSAFRTRFRLGRALPETIMDVYDDTPAGEMRRAMSRGHGEQAGDPVKLAQAVLKLLAGDELPQMFIAGSEGQALFERRQLEERASFERWREFGAHLDCDD